VCVCVCGRMNGEGSRRMRVLICSHVRRNAPIGLLYEADPASNRGVYTAKKNSVKVRTHRQRFVETTSSKRQVDMLLRQVAGMECG